MSHDDAGRLDQELLGVEREGWQALSRVGGADSYRANLTDDALMVFPMGTLGRQQILDTIAGASPWDTFEIEDAQVVPLTAESAILTYRVTAQRPQQERYAALATTVFVRRAGAWRTAFHQQTPLAAYRIVRR